MACSRRSRERRGLRLRLRYEHLQPEVADDPEPFEPDADDLAAIEEELRAAVERDAAPTDDWQRRRRRRGLPHLPLPLDLPRQRGAGRPDVADARPTTRAPTGSRTGSVGAMPIDPRTPVLVGVGQAQQRVADPTAAREPIDLLADAARAADADARRGASLLARVDIGRGRRRSARGSTPTRARCSRRRLGIDAARPRSSRRSAATARSCS